MTSSMLCLVLVISSMSISTRFLLQVAKVVDELLTEQGGKRLVPVGLGDDDQCIEDDFNAWKEALWLELDQLLRDENDVSIGTTYIAAIPKYWVEFIKTEDVAHLERNFSLAKGHAVHDAQHLCQANVVVRRELHTLAFDHSCTHLEFDIASTSVM